VLCLLLSDAKPKAAEKAEMQQVAAADIEQKTSVLDISQHSTSGDEVSSRQEKSQDHEPQTVSELEASGQEDTAARDSSETGLQHEDDDGKKLHDSGQQVASRKVAEETCCEQEVSEQDVGERGSAVEEHDVPGRCEVKTGKSKEQQDDAEERVSGQQGQENVPEEQG